MLPIPAGRRVRSATVLEDGTPRPLVAFLSPGPEWTLVEGGLRLTSGSTTIVFDEVGLSPPS